MVKEEDTEGFEGLECFLRGQLRYVVEGEVQFDQIAHFGKVREVVDVT